MNIFRINTTNFLEWTTTPPQSGKNMGWYEEVRFQGLPVQTFTTPNEVPETVFHDGSHMRLHLPTADNVHTLVLQDVVNVDSMHRNVPDDIFRLLDIYHVRAPAHLGCAVVRHNASKVFISHEEFGFDQEVIKEIENSIRGMVERVNLRSLTWLDNRRKANLGIKMAQILYLLFNSASGNLRHLVLRLPKYPQFDDTYAFFLGGKRTPTPRNIPVVTVNDSFFEEGVFREWLSRTRALTHLQVNVDRLKQVSNEDDPHRHSIQVLRWCMTHSHRDDNRLAYFDSMLNILPDFQTVCLHARGSSDSALDALDHVIQRFMLRTKSIVIEGRYYHMVTPPDDDEAMDCKDVLLQALESFAKGDTRDRSITLSLEVVVEDHLFHDGKLVFEIQDTLVQDLKSEMNHRQKQVVLESLACIFNLRVISIQGDKRPAIVNMSQHNTLKKLLDPLEYYRTWDTQTSPLEWLD